MDLPSVPQNIYCHTPNLPNSSESSPNPQRSSQKMTHFKNIRKFRQTPKAYPDSVMIQPRVLYNVTTSEDRYLPSPSYFTCIQTEVQPYMRKILVTWMYEVCEELHRRKDVFQLAVNYLDRFLSSINTPKSHLQLLGASCMLLASKFKEAHPVSSELLCVYTDNSIKMADLLSWELLVANVLSWDLAAPTSCYILEMLSQLHPLMLCIRENGNLTEAIKLSAQQILDKCTLDHTFASHPPSMMASASLSLSYITHCQQVFRTLNDSFILQFLNGTTALTGIELDVLRNLMAAIGQTLSSQAPSRLDPNQGSGCYTPQAQCISTPRGHQLIAQDHDYLASSSKSSVPSYNPDSSSCYLPNSDPKYNQLSADEMKKIAEIYPTPPPLERGYKVDPQSSCAVGSVKEQYTHFPDHNQYFIHPDIPQTDRSLAFF